MDNRYSLFNIIKRITRSVDYREGCFYINCNTYDKLRIECEQKISSKYEQLFEEHSLEKGQFVIKIPIRFFGHHVRIDDTLKDKEIKLCLL